MTEKGKVGVCQKMDTGRIDALLQEQERLLEVNRQNGQKWTNLKEDYVKLDSKLETIADESSHEVMVPLGKKAFMPGKLIHTNEVLVLLGDNWFAERSSKQAKEIVQRRIKQCNETIAKYLQEKELVENWKKETMSLRELDGGNVEITEPFDEEQEKIWREEHRLRMKVHKEQEKKNLPSEQDDDEELWRKLDELELQEELDGYLEAEQEQEQVEEMKGEKSKHSMENLQPSELKRNVSFGNMKEQTHLNLPEADYVIKVVHKTDLPSPNKNVEHLKQQSPENLSPHDLEGKFCSPDKQSPKSILKPFDPSSVIVNPFPVLADPTNCSKETTDNKPATNVQTEPKPEPEPEPESEPEPETLPVPAPVDAVSDVVVERQQEPSGVLIKPKSLGEPQKIGKFRVSRMKL